MRSTPFRSAIAAAVVVLLSTPLTVLPFPGASSASASFTDTGAQPAEIQEAIGYCAGKGYMKGGKDGRFRPEEPISRVDYARAVVRLFGRQTEEPGDDVHFTDMKEGDSGYKYACLAVKHGYIRPMDNGAFGPAKPVKTVEALAGVVEGLGFDLQLQHLRGLYPEGPSHGADLVIAHDLHLKYRNTRTRPDHDYPRGEMAFTLKKADVLEEWREEYVRESFDWLHCQSPWLGTLRKRAMDCAFSRLGYPYVWAGESDEEGGYDCSGFVYFVLKTNLGYPMMRTADDQARDGRYPAVSRWELLAGDPVFFYSDVTGDTSARVGHAGLYIGQGLFIHSTGSNGGVSVDCLSGYWRDHFAWGKRVIDEPEPCTFDTYILLMNPSDRSATAVLTYMMQGGHRCQREVSLAPYSRKTVRVDDTLVNQEVSTEVDVTGGEVVAERSMYYRYRGRYPGGHDSPGVTEPATEWYLPEGCTAFHFDTYILIQNPNDRPASIIVTYMTDGGTTVEQRLTVPPFSRRTIEVDRVEGLEEAQFGARVVADMPVVVERSMYFDYSGVREGHNSPGTTELRSEWYFAEGYTDKGFDSYLLLMNPNDRAADIVVSLFGPDGETADIDLVMEPHSRRTVAVDRIGGWEHKEFSALVRSRDLPVAAERAVYFDYDGISGGHDALGTPAPSDRWYLAEGYTAQEFDTYILMLNPGREEAQVHVRYMLGGGGFKDRSYTVKPHSRRTVRVDRVKGLEAQEVSAFLESDRPIVVERSMYFRYKGREGGSCGPAVCASSPRWYFAEGYTGR